MPLKFHPARQTLPWEEAVFSRPIRAFESHVRAVGPHALASRCGNPGPVDGLIYLSGFQGIFNPHGGIGLAHRGITALAIAFCWRSAR